MTQTGAGLAVFGTDNALWWIHQTTSGTWSSWQSLGGVITSQPGSAAGVTVGFGPPPRGWWRSFAERACCVPGFRSTASGGEPLPVHRPLAEKCM